MTYLHLSSPVNTVYYPMDDESKTLSLTDWHAPDFHKQSEYFY